MVTMAQYLTGLIENKNHCLNINVCNSHEKSHYSGAFFFPKSKKEDKPEEFIKLFRNGLFVNGQPFFNFQGGSTPIFGRFNGQNERIFLTTPLSMVMILVYFKQI